MPPSNTEVVRIRKSRGVQVVKLGYIEVEHERVSKGDVRRASHRRQKLPPSTSIENFLMECDVLTRDRIFMMEILF